MKVPIAAVTALALTPAAADAWMLARPSFFDFDRPLVLSPSEILRDQQAMIQRMGGGVGFKQSSPRYEIINDDQKFQVAVDVPGVKMEDIHVSLEHDNSVLSISGEREASGESYRFTSKFSQSFSLDPSIDIDKFAASMKDGVLIVSAPKDMKRLEQSVRNIPISMHQDTAKPALEENNVKDAKVEASDNAKQELKHEIKVEAPETVEQK